MRMRALVLCLLFALPASAARVAVVVGANLGAAADPPLRFAERDARRVAETLLDVGGVPRSELKLLAGADAASVLAALQDTRGKSLLFYYSGHAGLDGLHLRGEVIPWARLRELSEGGAGELRIIFVDACHAGELARAKGFIAVPPEKLPDESRGSAVLAAAEWFEAAQESDALGGSFFTHALVSGLRGAADSDGDGQVTLAELHSFVSRDTTARTSAASPVQQHPTYRFDISGRGDVVLARLREADARLTLAGPLEGTVVVLEADSPFVVVEANKRRGDRLAFALPRGRYQVHVRGASSVGIAEVTLPWGGEARVGPRELHARSYQEVALKGGIVQLRRFRLRAGATIESAPLSGMGFLPAGTLVGGGKIGPVELGVRFAAGSRSFDAVDTHITATVFEAGAFAAWEWPLRFLDLRAWVALDVARWWEKLSGAADRENVVPAVGLGAGLRLPLSARLFAEAGIEGRALFPEIQGQGREARVTARGDLLLGVVF
jgi:Caspase domain